MSVFSSLFFLIRFLPVPVLLTVIDIVAIQRSARTRSSLSCSIASPCSRYTSLTFSCTLYLCREAKRVLGRAAHVCDRGMGCIGALGGSIAFCGSYQSSACRSISTCVKHLFFLLCVCVLPCPVSPSTATAYRSFCRPRGVLLSPNALIPCDMVSRFLMLE